MGGEGRQAGTSCWEQERHRAVAISTRTKPVRVTEGEPPLKASNSGLNSARIYLKHSSCVLRYIYIYIEMRPAYVFIAGIHNAYIHLPLPLKDLVS